MANTWICAFIEDDKGVEGHYVFDSEEELRYFLAIHDNYIVTKVIVNED